MLILLALAAFASSAEPLPAPAPAAPPAAPAPAPPQWTRARIAVAFRIGDCAGALAASQSLPGFELAQARCHLRLGQDAKAKHALDASTDGTLGPWLEWTRAELALREKHPTQALGHLEGVRLPGRAGLQLALLRAEALQADGQLPEAQSKLEALLDGPVQVEARLRLARMLPAAQARPHALALWGQAAPAPIDAEAAALLEPGFPDLTQPELRELALQRVKALRKSLRYAEAYALGTALRTSGATPGLPSEATLAFDARAYPDAVAAYRAQLGPPAEATGSPAALFDYALGTARTGDYATSEIIYARLIAQHPKSDEASEARFKQGYMPWDAGDCATAAPRLRALAKDPLAQGHTDDAAWFASRCAWRAADYPTMRADLEGLLQRTPHSSLADGARYWLARTEGAAGDKTAGQAALRAILSEGGTTGYQAFAAQRLGQAYPPQEPAQQAPWPEALASTAAVRTSQALLAQGLASYARDALSEVKATTEQDKLALAHALLAAGDAKAARALVAKRCRPPSTPMPAEIKGLCVPQPEREIVLAAIEGSSLPAWVPFAIMQAESNFDATVTSPAGARGLMQLMPEVARGLHTRAFPGRPFDANDLYDSGYNAYLGSTELARLHDSLKGSLQGWQTPAAIAGYNAGLEPVTRWLNAAGASAEPDVWAEDVSYTETRRYVKRVLGFGVGLRQAFGDEVIAQGDKAKASP